MAEIGYIRVSSVDQKLTRQLDGLSLDKTFIDTVSAGSMARPGLTSLREYIREGDVVHVHSIDRLARNLADLLAILEDFISNGISLKFHKEGLTFSGENNPFQRLQVQIIGAVAEFERSMIRERQREGIIKAKQDPNKYRGRKPTINTDLVYELSSSGLSPTNIAKQLGIARSSVYRVLNSRK